MADFKLELPKGIPPSDRAELARALAVSARVETGTAQMRDFDAAQTLFVVAATVQTIDILWHWFQAARAKGNKWNVVVTMANGDEVHLERISLDELKKLID